MEVSARDVTVTAAPARSLEWRRRTVRGPVVIRWIARSPDAALDPRAEDLAMDLMQ